MSDPAQEKPGIGAPLQSSVFRALWVASFFSNIGTLIQVVAAAWLMTSLTTSPLMVGLIQTAAMLPVFLFGPLAGALADLVQRRSILISTQFWMLVVAGLLSAATFTGFINPWLLLAFTFCMGVGNAFTLPAWQANVQDIVPRKHVSAAISLNSISFNAARSVGPAIGGAIVAVAGPAAAFLLNAVSFSGTLGVLTWWKPEKPRTRNTEDVFAALQAGFRYAFHAQTIHAPLVRVGAFMLCASVTMALMPIVARDRLGLSAVGFGLLLTAFGVGSIVGAVFIPKLRHWLALDRLVGLATALAALILLVIGLTTDPVVVGIAMFFWGAAWVGTLVNFNVAVQTSVPNWVRGRAMSIYLLTFQGSMAIGAALWGGLATRFGLAFTFEAAAAGMMLSLLLVRRLPLPSEELDLRPVTQWHEPTAPPGLEPEDGPVLVEVEYAIPPEKVTEFRDAMRELRRLRLRDGAVRWRLYRDTLRENRYVELFRVNSWGDYLRQQSRMTRADEGVKSAAERCHGGPEPPRMQHFLQVEL